MGGDQIQGKSMKRLAIVALVVSLTACVPRTESVENDSRLPKELQDCTIHKLSDGSGTRLYVVDCPNRKTTSTVRTGKNQVYVSLV